MFYLKCLWVFPEMLTTKLTQCDVRKKPLDGLPRKSSPVKSSPLYPSEWRRHTGKLKAQMECRGLILGAVGFAKHYQSCPQREKLVKILKV